jgi:hypothetical protein
MHLKEISFEDGWHVEQAEWLVLPFCSIEISHPLARVLEVAVAPVFRWSLCWVQRHVGGNLRLFPEFRRVIHKKTAATN